MLTLADVREKFQDIWVDEAAYPAVLPKTTMDVMRVVAWARGSGWRLLPVGRGHSFGDSFKVPGGVLTVLSLARDGVSSPDPGDLVVEVESGAPASAVAQHVHEEGFRLDGWPEDYAGTVGGLLCGPKGIRLRPLVLGVDIVDGRGRSLRFGGRVRKDVSGFDIAGLFPGSRGAIGWLDRAYLRLTPLGAPEIGRALNETRTTSGAFEDLALRVCRSLDPDDVFLKPLV